MVSINAALRQVKADLADLLSDQTILQRCRQLGHPWRQSLLNPAVTLHLWIIQILYGNTACTNLRHLAKRTFSASAYCQARGRLPLDLIRQLVRDLGQRISSQPGLERWRGHRLWMVDGSNASMPDTPELQAHFGQPSGQRAGCGFPVASLLLLMHAASGAILDLLIRPLRVHDLSGMLQLHEDLKPGDVLLGDRAFSSYVHLALLAQRGVFSLFRVHQRTIVSFRPGRAHTATLAKARRRDQPTAQWVKHLGPLDQRVRYFKPKEKPTWIGQEQFDALPESLLVREVRYRVQRRGFRVRQITLVTTLLDPLKYPAQELADRFLDRWLIEGNLDHLKTTMGASVLHCQTVAGVSKELGVFALAYNLVRQVMLTAARRQRVPPHRISFVDALRWLAHQRGDAEMYDLVVVPLREGRLEPRVIKRRMKPFPLMRQPRAVLKQALMRQKLAA
jgi:hypothetical protein